MKIIKKTIAKKFLFVFVLVFTSGVLTAQDKYIDKKGNVSFEASEELFEPVKASNTSVTAILNTDTGEMASLALMKSFRFKNSLMEEHFNENYIESETYPKAIFKGQLQDFDVSKLIENNTEIKIDGKVELRGKEKEVNTTLYIKKSNGVIYVTGSFKVTPADFNIEIPGVVKNKIAKEIIVSIDFSLIQK